VRRSLALGAAAAVAALLAGCGSSSSSSSSSSTAASTPASTASTQSPAASTSTTAASGSGVAIESKHAKLGTILAAGPKKLTVYMFEADKGTTSSCSGACAKVWPPVTTSGAPTAAGGAVSADLGTTKRSDGTEQVTYKGHPLYFYDDDKDAGDAYGQGSKAFGASWYVLKPSGAKIDEDSGDGKGGASGGSGYGS
jgi:predicted lipoprotein with Yx(FWY)xxD motif